MPRPLTQAPHLSGQQPREADTAPISQSTAPSQSHFAAAPGRSARAWKPRRIFFTAAAWQTEHGRRIAERLDGLGLTYERLNANRLPKLTGGTTREMYRRSKDTLAIVNAPKGQFRLQPIPPSADWQFHLAKGCPAHCQYCYLAGSLPGAPITRVYANLDAILDNLDNYVQEDRPVTSFEASCYTDPLGLEHLTGSISRTIEHFGTMQNAHLRWVTKYDNVDPLLKLQHRGNTRCRISLNADWVTKRLEGGTADLQARLVAMRRLAKAGYPVGAVLAPLMPFPGWQKAYTDLLDRLAAALDFSVDLTFELITHRFTPGSKEVLLDWYPNTKLDLDEENRRRKFNKFGTHKFVYRKEQQGELKLWFTEAVTERFGEEGILYFT